MQCGIWLCFSFAFLWWLMLNILLVIDISVWGKCLCIAFDQFFIWVLNCRFLSVCWIQVPYQRHNLWKFSPALSKTMSNPMSWSFILVFPLFLHIGLWTILSKFICMVQERDSTLFFCWIFSYPSTICWRLFFPYWIFLTSM